MAEPVNVKVNFGTEGAAAFGNALREIARQAQQLSTDLEARRRAQFTGIGSQGGMAAVMAGSAGRVIRPDLMGQMATGFRDLNEAMLKTSAAATALSAGLAGLVYAGIHSSSAGKVIAFEFEQL